MSEDKKPNKYNNGKIYTIRYRDDNNLIYVGSTVQPLYKRWNQHKRRYKKEKYNNTLLYIKMNEMGIEKFYIELYEMYKCNTKEELKKHEGEVIRQIATLNMRVEGRTRKEYYNDNIEIISEHQKQYRNKNKEKYKQYDMMSVLPH